MFLIWMGSSLSSIACTADDEVRYIIDGEGVFGFVLPPSLPSQMELTVQPEAYINVPAGTEHWFYLTPQRRLKALRYFTGTEGWTPLYTGKEIKREHVTFADALICHSNNKVAGRGASHICK